ncbi:hypothetical protein [Micromonospora cremea]|uniref:Uncharacterized protein n=1 Tax=Micromonospora cremea TaxID=709881 RepID=A0A1N5U2C5_9ACTN|nr:hypothetical protein [Micromonospora cremea]SIM54487.1 hypothetical protein SAMN04489832_0530 [Micromonospora cremea]
MSISHRPPGFREGGGASKAGRTAGGGEQLAADPATGQRRVLTSLPDRALVILPGD